MGVSTQGKYAEVVGGGPAKGSMVVEKPLISYDAACRLRVVARRSSMCRPVVKVCLPPPM